jgi:hypothetical protein
MLDTQGYKNTLRICNVYCFPLPTVAARKRLDVTLFSNHLNISWQSYTVLKSDTVVTRTINIKQTSRYKTRAFRNYKVNSLIQFQLHGVFLEELTVPYVVKKFSSSRNRSFVVVTTIVPHCPCPGLPASSPRHLSLQTEYSLIKTLRFNCWRKGECTTKSGDLRFHGSGYEDKRLLERDDV